jgi:tetratricopeptide (TPR) repeat protein
VVRWKAVPDGRLKQGLAGLVHRETVLLVALCAVAVAAYFLTRSVAAANRRIHVADAARAYSAGETQVRAGDPRRAAASFRRAIALDPFRREYRLALADALTAGHDDDAARFVLQQLRDLEPEDATRTKEPAAGQSDANGFEELGRIVDEIIARDPLAPRLAAGTRRERVRSMFDELHKDLAVCGGGALTGEAEAAAVEAHRRRSFSTETITADVAQAAGLTARSPAQCRDRPLERAIVLIAKRHGIAVP